MKQGSKKIELSEQEFVEGLSASITAAYFGSSVPGPGCGAPSSVSEFLSRYTSEDNESFRVLQIRDADIVERRERGGPSSDALGITYSGQQRARVEAHPQLKDHSTSYEARSRIADMGRLAAIMPPPTGRQSRQVQASRGGIVPSNTRFAPPNASTPGYPLSGMDLESVVSGSDLSGVEISSTFSLGFVPMTPILRAEHQDHDGIGDDSWMMDNDYGTGTCNEMVIEPIMTWGQIAGMPVLLDTPIVVSENGTSTHSTGGLGSPRPSMASHKQRKHRGSAQSSLAGSSSVRSSVTRRSNASMVAQLPGQAQDLLRRLQAKHTASKL
jgi:hypothetical protein